MSEPLPLVWPPDDVFPAGKVVFTHDEWVPHARELLHLVSRALELPEGSPYNAILPAIRRLKAAATAADRNGLGSP